MRAEGVPESVPIVMAGGVWFLREWDNWIDNDELGSIAFHMASGIYCAMLGFACWREHRRETAT